MHSILRGEEGLKAALGRIPSGLYAVGARHEGRRIGMLCSFVEQAGFEPPMISLALGTDRPLRSVLEHGGLFSLNILGTEDKRLLAAFASGPMRWPGWPAVRGDRWRPVITSFMWPRWSKAACTARAASR